MNPECAACGSTGYLEPLNHPVGDCVLCGECYRWLTKHGHIQLDKKDCFVSKKQTWLYPDGAVKEMELVKGKFKPIK